MAKTAKPKDSLEKYKMKRFALVTVLIDIVLLALFVVSILHYTSGMDRASFRQNTESIVNIADANAALLQTGLDNAAHELERVYGLCRNRRPGDILDYLSQINLEGEEYQLLWLDTEESTALFSVYRGFSTVKINSKYQSVEYEDTALAISLRKYEELEEGKTAFTRSFTNKTDSMRYFGVFCGITVNDNGTYRKFCLVKLQKESKALNYVQTSTSYQSLSVAACYTDGKYLAYDDAFRSSGFFDYLEKYNDLSLEIKESLIAQVSDSGEDGGYFIYRNYRGEECVFAFSVCPKNSDLMAVVAVPTSDFISEKMMTLFPWFIIGFMSLLLIFNVYRLLYMVMQLRLRVERERFANASKSAFLSRMSHEIRTPLNAVIGYNTIAKDALAETEEESSDIYTHRQAEMQVLDCLEKSGIASKHLLSIINDVLDMSSIESGKIKLSHEKFDFKGLVTSLTTVFYSQARSKGVDFSVVIGTITDEWFIGDQMRTNQILTNLLSNAVKFTPEGGSVVLKLRQQEGPANTAHIHFSVSDTGIGMTDEYKKHLWTPFEQADSSISRRFGGTGLGLSITKTLVDLMGGTITVESAVGKGTVFDIDLTFDIAERNEADMLYDFSGINALAVDDDASTCDYIRLLFNCCSAKCAVATFGEEAIKAVGLAVREGKPYTMALVDWRMPHMDGIETIKRIREIAGEELPIIVLTAYDFSEIAEQAGKIGVSRFISKPLFRSSLFDMLTNICGEPAPGIEERPGKQDFGGAHVLLAEDNAMNMEIAKRLLSSANLNVDCAWNGREALDMFNASEPGYYDIILMDVHMPEMNGLDSTRGIRASGRPDAASVPIYAMIADSFAENVQEALGAGMNGHISKPIDITALFGTLKNCLKKK